MSTKITMPKLGLTMTEGTVVEWIKKEGETVEKGSIIFVIETEKVTYEVEAPASGILNILVKEGQIVPVGGLLGYILQEGEKPEQMDAQPIRISVTKKEAISQTDTASFSPDEPTIRKGKIRISPLARKIAEEHKVDISGIRGTGPEGRIVKADVLKSIDEAKSRLADDEAGHAELPFKGKVIPLTAMRRTIARKMTESFQHPHIWTVQRADVSKLKEARDQLLPSIEAATGQRLTYTDIIIKIVTRALQDFPIVNSRWSDDGIVIFDDINIGLAVNVDKGLIVPVIRGAERKSLSDITMARADLVRRAREGKLTIEDISGGTFTITNVGILGVEYSYPVINHPEVAILALGGIKERPAVINGAIKPVLSVNLTIASDHRVLDGWIHAQFLNRIRDMIENPILLI